MGFKLQFTSIHFNSGMSLQYTWKAVALSSRTPEGGQSGFTPLPSAKAEYTSTSTRLLMHLAYEDFPN
jgi:hypothetical protein